MKSFLTSILFFICSGIATAQIVTDRPDATESAVTVPDGAVQIESGISFENLDERIDHNTIALPMGLLRYGLFANLELRFAFDYQHHSTSIFDDFLEAPFSLGIKYSIAKENGLIPDFAILSHVSIDYTNFMGTYSHSENTDPEVEFVETGNYIDKSFDIRLAFAYSLPMDFAFGGNFGTIVWMKPEDSRTRQLMKTDARYFDLYEWTANLEYSASQELAFYSELFGDFNSNEARTNLNVGVKFLATQNMQIDAFYVKVLSLPEAEKMNDDYYQFGFGFSYLWD